MDDSIRQTLVEIADFLDSVSVRFVLIGGLAVAVRGEPRVTADVDLVAGVDLDRALVLIGEFERTDFRPLFADVSELVQTALLLPLRHNQTRIKVDLAIGLSGFEKQVIDRATSIQVANRTIPVASAEDLILMKLLAARPRDTADVDGIVGRQRGALDWKYLFQTGGELQEAVGIDIVPQLERRKEQ